MKTDKNNLIDQLLLSAKNASAAAKRFKTLSPEKLNYKPTPDSWSILECIEHLNLYGDYYLPEIERRIAAAKNCSSSTFKSGFLGNKFVKMMEEKNGGIRKMKARADKNPIGSDLNIITVDRFIKQQYKLKLLLQSAREVNLSKVRTGISIMPVLKIRLGDTLRFLAAHTERHLNQARMLAD